MQKIFVLRLIMQLVLLILVAPYRCESFQFSNIRAKTVRTSFKYRTALSSIRPSHTISRSKDKIPISILVAAKSLYKVQSKGSESSPFIIVAKRVFEIFSNLNPIQILGGMYVLILIGMFASGVVSKSKKLVKSIQGQTVDPPQLYECEFCKLEMRPARGRETQIFSRRGFRCAQCGAPGSAFFNTENLGDPRAVARLRRIEKEKKKEQEKYYGKSDSDDEYEDE